MEIVLKHLGYLLIIFSVFPIMPIVAALYYREPVIPFIVPVVISLLLGYWLVSRSKAGKTSVYDFDLPRSISLSALSYVVISFIGMLPYVIIPGTSFINGLFESVSGFSTTGLTILNDVEVVPKSLLLWRAETQWIGGLGIVILFLVIVSAMRSQDSLKDTTTKARAVATLYQAQGASEKIEANMEKSMRNTILIYGAYTLLGIFLLAIAGLSTFEAISISFTAISTAGFSVTNQFYTSWPVLLVVAFLIIAGAVSFVLHNALFKGRWKELFVNRPLRSFLALVAVAILCVFAVMGEFKFAFFNTISAFTTTGFSIGDLNKMPVLAVMVIMSAMIIGGMIGSTAGGIKVNRFRLMLKSIPWMVKKTASPYAAIVPMKVDKQVIDDENLLMNHAFIACYILILFFGTAILLLTGLSFFHASFQSVSALGGVGLQTADIAAFHPVAKVVLMVMMLFGRLEIIPLLVLFRFFVERTRSDMRKRDEESRKRFYIKSAISALWKRKL
jgi:trk system potassium uptake protein TrkH